MMKKKRLNPIFPRTRMRANFSDAKLNMEECQQFVRNELQKRGSRPFGFVRTAPCYNPYQPVARNIPSGHCRNPQTEAFLEMLGLRYCLDTFTESMGLPQTCFQRISE